MIFSELFSLVGNLFIGSWCLWSASTALVDAYGRRLMHEDKTEDQRRQQFMLANDVSHIVWFVLSLLWALNLVVRIWIS